MTNTNDITIIIPFHKDAQMLSLSLRTLEDTLGDKKPEVIIVGNNSNYSEIDISLDSQKYKLYKIDRNLFWPGAINFGAAHASCKNLLFCDPDIFYMNNWLDELLKVSSEKENIGVVSSKLVNPLNNRIMDFGMGYNQYNTIHITKGLHYNHPLCQSNRKVQAACGGILYTTHDLFEKVNGIDTTMPYIYCDNDYSIKVAEYGLETWVASKSVVYHKGNTDTKNSKYQNFSYLREDSKAAFYAKNYAKRKVDTSEWLKNTWIWYLKNENNKQSNYYLFNFCTLPDADEYIDIFTQTLGLHILNNTTVILSQRDTQIINLCNHISPVMLSSRIPFLYFVDDFTSLLYNKLWFALRDVSKDLVIDRHCNILNMSELQKQLL